MSIFIQELREPYPAQTAPLPVWSQCNFTGSVDPLVDRAMKMAGIGAWSCDLANDKLSWTSGVYDIFGLPSETAIDRRQTVEMCTDQSREELERLRRRTIAIGGAFKLDAQIIRPNGEMRWMRIHAEMIHRGRGSATLHGSKQDVTDEKLRTDALRRLAENDALTGLASRAIYEQRFLNRRRIDTAEMPIGALILFDLDGFKQINDRWGHLAGDACLKVFAQRLSASFPEALLASRIGGDEFALIIGNNKPLATIEAGLADFLAQLRAPILWREHIFTIGATSGIAVPLDPYCYDPEELFVEADAVLYALKRARGGHPTRDRRQAYD